MVSGAVIARGDAEVAAAGLSPASGSAGDPVRAEEHMRYASMEKTRPDQLDLFDGALPASPHAYTQSFAIYDLAPKYVFRTDEREAGKYLPVVHRTFRLADREYQLEIRPARVMRDGAEIEVYPGEREQVLEEALRRIAIEKRRTRL